MILTIALVVYNEENQIPLIEENLKVFARYAQTIQVLIIDNASNDQTRVHLTQLNQKYCFQLIERDVNNMGAARAQAVDQATTDWVGFLDADCAIDKNWVDQVLSLIPSLTPEVVAFGGPWIPAGESAAIFSSLFRTFGGNFNMPQIINDNTSRLARHIPTACVVYRKKSLLEVGNFDDQRVSVGEDLDMSYRLLSSGGVLKIYPVLKFSHYLPVSGYLWFKKIVSYGQARIHVAAKYKDLLSANYILPLLFFIFMALNIIFIKQFMAIPFLIYLGFVFIMSCLANPKMALTVSFYMIATHWAYSLGMAMGVVSLLYQKSLRRKPVSPIGYRPRSLEEI